MSISPAPVFLAGKESFNPWVGQAREAGSLWTRLGKKGSPQALWNRQMEMQGKHRFIPDLLWRFGGTGKLSRSMIFVSAQAVETNEVEKWRIQEENKSLVPTSEKKKPQKLEKNVSLLLALIRIKNTVAFPAWKLASHVSTEEMIKKQHKPCNFAVTVIMLTSVSTGWSFHKLPCAAFGKEVWRKLGRLELKTEKGEKCSFVLALEVNWKSPARGLSKDSLRWLLDVSL